MATDKINVRTAPPQLNRIGTYPQQNLGVHGTVKSGPVTGTADGFTGNWWEIDWDAGTDGWCAESFLTLAPPDGDVAQPIFSSRYCASDDNRFWKTGDAPRSTNPQAPCQLGNALGNCTWYAFGRMVELGYCSAELLAIAPPGWGEAKLWAGNARLYAKSYPIVVDQNPTVGSIAQSELQDHVAVVESRNADGTITVTESAFVSKNPAPYTVWNFLWRHRTVPVSAFENYIHINKAHEGNHPPVARPRTLMTTRDAAQAMQVAKVLSACIDPDGDPLSIGAVSAASAQGGSAQLTGGIITYTPPAGFVGTDSFTYTLSDGRGGLAEGTVTVTVSAPASAGSNQLTIIVVPGAAATVHFAGIPNLSYDIEASTDLSAWTKIGTATAGANGLFVFVDENAGSYPSRYYRTRSP